MFTGIIEELGIVKNLQLRPTSAVMTIEAQKVMENTRIGDSIAVNGVCLTVTELALNHFTVDVMAETLAKTNLAELKRGNSVNLERALQLQSRLGGHLVSGHVDGVGTLQKITQVGIANVYEIIIPAGLLAYILPKGSVAVDGISLTVVEVTTHSFTVSLIPHTFQSTVLGSKRPGDKVNIETDLIGKYIAKLMNKDQPGSVTLDFLAEHGYI